MTHFVIGYGDDCVVVELHRDDGTTEQVLLDFTEALAVTLSMKRALDELAAHQELIKAVDDTEKGD